VLNRDAAVSGEMFSDEQVQPSPKYFDLSIIYQWSDENTMKTFTIRVAVTQMPTAQSIDNCLI
jgi:hypothetical protein